MMASESSDAFSVDEFARRHRIGRTAAYEEIKNGRLIARKVRGRTIVTIEDAKAWRASLPRVLGTNVQASAA